MDDDLEEYERVNKIAQLTTIAGTIISILLNVWVILSLMTELLGINVGTWARMVIEHGWTLPKNWVYKYQPFLYTLQWVLLMTVIVDTVMAYKYSVDGEPKVPLPYLRVVSFIGFFCGMWLYLAYHIVAYGLIFIASFVTFMWSMFVKEEEDEENEEDFSPEIWKAES